MLQGIAPLLGQTPAPRQRLREPVQLHKDNRYALIYDILCAALAEGVLRDEAVVPFRPVPLEAEVHRQDSRQVHRREIIVPVAGPGVGIIHLRRILHASQEQVPLPRRLHLHDEMPAALALAPQIQPYRLVCRSEARDLRPGEGQAPDPAPLGKDGVEEADDDVPVGLVAEHRLEAGVGKDVHIPLIRTVRFLHFAHITQILWDEDRMPTGGCQGGEGRFF